MSRITSPVEHFFNRFNVIIFTIIAGAVLAFTTYTCYVMYDKATTPDDSKLTSQVPTNFDKKVRKKIDNLSSRNDNTEITLPENQRINPFK